MRKIIKNCIRCKNCGEFLISETPHALKYCSCGRVAVDGGLEYLRRITAGTKDDYEELSEYEDY